MQKLFSSKNKHASILVTLIALTVSLFYMSVYLGGELRGNINWHMLSAEMFGIPTHLVEKGLTPLYHGASSGWDGQFYYYIANDLKGTPDTILHIDADAYRYQRVGLSLLAKIVSLFAFKSWVSPLTYYLTNLSLILLATFVWASYLQKKGYSPWIALFWSLGIGTQLTLLNGLPDAAADSCIIIALICYLRQSFALYTVTITFAILSREVYLLIPAVLGCFSAWHWFNTRPRCLTSFIQLSAKHAIPAIIWCIWWVYILLHFHKTPSSQAFGILDFHLLSWKHYLIRHARGGTNLISRLLFFVLIFISIKIIVKDLFNGQRMPAKDTISVHLAFLPIFLLYLCFGPTVMINYSGFMKAATILFFFIPFSYVLSQQPIPRSMIIFLSLITLFFMHCLYVDRVKSGLSSILHQYSSYPKNMKVSQAELSCLRKPRSQLHLVGIEDFYYNGFFRRLRRLPETKIFTVQVKNLTESTFPVTNGKGAIRLSYQWLDQTDHVKEDGIRSFIPQLLLPNQIINLPMVVEFPKHTGVYKLVISLVQENCNWFYRTGDPGVIQILYTFH